MDKLASKGYWEQLGNSPEMVVMFLPGETLFSAALQHDLTLIEYGLAQRVLLASPITLIALLTTIAHTWRQEALNDNYREVATLGREFYERLARFAEHFDDVRQEAGRGGAVLQPGGRIAREPGAGQRAAAARPRCDDRSRIAADRADRHRAAHAEVAAPRRASGP